MSRHHVRPDGSVGRCDAKEGGRCKFAREGALHFESASEAQEYAAELLANRSGGFTQGGAGYDSGGGSKVALIAERDGEMSLEELDAHMDRLCSDSGVWERVVSSPDAMVGELAAVANGALDTGGRENLLLAVRAVRHENMIPDVRRYVVTHPDLWDEALSDPEFYGWSSDDVRDVFEVSREVGLSDVEKRQRVNGRFADRDLPKWGPPRSVSDLKTRASNAVSDIYRMRGFVRLETPRKVTRTRDLSDSELIREAAERAMGGGAGE